MSQATWDQLLTNFYSDLDSPHVAAEELSKYLSDDFVDHNPPPEVPAELTDKAVNIDVFAQLKTGFSEMNHQLAMLEMLGDDKAVVYWIFTAVHSGVLYGVPASDRSVRICGIDIFTLSDGQIKEQWHVEDIFTLMQQIK